MPKEVVEQGTFERVVVAIEKLAGHPEVLTGVEELSTALAGPNIDSPVGPAIEKLAEAGLQIARALDRLAAVPAAMPVKSCCSSKEPAAPGPDPACVGPANPYEGMGRKELRKLCDRRKVHTNSKMSIAKLIGLLDQTPGA